MHLSHLRWSRPITTATVVSIQTVITKELATSSLTVTTAIALLFLETVSARTENCNKHYLMVTIESLAIATAREQATILLNLSMCLI
jgi:uncharacterized protein (DUF342 family)